MEKPEPYTHTIKNVLDYTQAVKYIDEVLGYPQRDAHRHFKAGMPEVQPNNSSGQQNEGEYLDYWHHVLEEFIDITAFRNGTFVQFGPYSFEEHYERNRKRYGELDWRTQIARVWAQEYPDPDKNVDPSGYEILMDW